jgi:hypothetical protein
VTREAQPDRASAGLHIATLKFVYGENLSICLRVSMADWTFGSSSINSTSIPIAEMNKRE